MKEYKGYKYRQERETWTVYTKEGKPWIVGFKTEAEAKAQIDDIIESETASQTEQITMEGLQQQVTNLQIALAELVEGGTL